MRLRLRGGQADLEGRAAASFGAEADAALVGLRQVTQAYGRTVPCDKVGRKQGTCGSLSDGLHSRLAAATQQE